MAGGRKEYELLLSLKAALGSNFNSTFTNAINTTRRLQNTLSDLKKVQGDISAYKKTEESVKRLKEEKEKLESSEKKNEAAIERVNRKIEEEEKRLADLAKQLQAAGVNTEKLTQENEKLKNVYDRVKKSQEDIARVNQKLESNAAAISKTRSELTKTIGALTAGGVAFYTGAIKPAAEFESAFAGVKKTIEGTPEQLLAIQNGIRKMATQIPLGTTEISAIAEAAGQLGIKTESILGFTRVMADLGVTTNLTGEEAASTLAKFANITGMSQANFDRLGATIVALGNDGASTEADIAAMGLRLAGAGKQIGLTEAQTLSFASALSSVGIEAEAGGSAFSKVMVDMQLATETGNKDLINFAKVAGISTKEFQKAFKTDAAGAISLFIKGLSNSQQKGESAIKILDEMGITEVRMRDALLRAAGANDVFTSSLEIGTKAWQENKALSDEAQQRYKTTESSIKIMKNAFNDIGISLGSVFLPQLAETVKKVSEVAVKFSEFAQKNPELIKTLMGVVGGLGALEVGTLAGKLGFLEMEKGVLNTVKGLLGFKAKAAESAAAAAMGGGKIANYFGGIKNALGGVDASVSKFDFAKKLMEKFNVGSLGQVISGGMGGVVNNILSPFQKMGGKIGGFLSPISGKITGAFGGIGSLIANGPLGKIGGVFKSLGGTVGAVLKPLGGLGGIFGGLFGKIMPIIAIVSLLATLFVKLNGGDISKFIEPLQAAFEAIKPTLQVVMEQLKGLGENLMPLLMDAANQLAPLFFQIVAAILPVAASLLQAIMPIIAVIAESVLPSLIGVLTTLMPPLTQLITSILPVVKMLIDALVPVITILANVLSSVLGAAINAVMPIIQNLIMIFQGVIDFVTGVFTGNWTQAWEGIKNIFGGIFGGLVELVKAPFRLIVGAVNGVIGGLNKLKVPDWIPGIGGKGINIPLIPTFAKGTNYTPDAFIAGEQGAELITNAKGRKVFTAAQTGDIFKNLQGIMSARQPESVVPPTVSVAASRSGGEIKIEVSNNPVIHVDGTAPNDLEEKLKAAYEYLVNLIMERLRQEKDNERRWGYA